MFGLSGQRRALIEDRVGLVVQHERVVGDSHIVTVKAFYPLLLMVSHEVSVHFRPRRIPAVGRRALLGALYSAFAGSAPTRYGVTELLFSALTSVFPAIHSANWSAVFPPKP